DALLRWCLVHAAVIVVGTEDYAASCPSLASVMDHVHVVELGIALERFQGPATPRTLAPATGSRTALLFVGRLSHYKGVDVLLNALVAVPSAELVIVGTGPEESRLRKECTDLGLDDRVRWHGHVPDARLPALYARSDILVLPSTNASESFGLVMVEAFACGIPVICSSLPGLRSVNEDDVTGLLVPPGDSAGLARAIQRLASDPDLRGRLGREATKEAQRYSEGEMASKTAALYSFALGIR